MKRKPSRCRAALVAAILVAGCSDPNSGSETQLEKIPLPPGVSDKPQEKPFKSRARSSSPPIGQQQPSK